MPMTSDHPDVSIRLAMLTESGTIASVLHAAFAPYEPAYTPLGFAATTPTGDQIERRWDEGPVWVAIGRDAGIVGTVAAVPRGDALYMRSMAVLPTTRGRGIGAALFQQVEQYARAQGHTAIVLSTTPFLASAIRLYERMGFRRTEDGPHDLHGTPLFTMLKSLMPPK